jgi:hypothetical protein
VVRVLKDGIPDGTALSWNNWLRASKVSFVSGGHISQSARRPYFRVRKLLVTTFMLKLMLTLFGCDTTSCLVLQLTIPGMPRSSSISFHPEFSKQQPVHWPLPGDRARQDAILKSLSNLFE